jgi:NAD(P)H dehydrogenase (quinone)
MTVYAVTGASGHVGRFAVDELLAKGVPPSDIVAIVRSKGKAGALAVRGVQVREADYSRPQTLDAALAGVTRLLLVSTSELGELVTQHRNVIAAAQAAGVSRIAYTSILNADSSTSPLAPGHRDTERVLRDAGRPLTLLRNGYYAEVYTDPLGQYLEHGEILGASGDGKMSAATRRDYAAAAAAALLDEDGGNLIYELGGPAFDVSKLAEVISEVTGTEVTYRNLTGAEYADALRRTGLDEAAAQFVAALDASIARGDMETSSQDLSHLLGRPATSLRQVVSSEYDRYKVSSRKAVVGLIGAGMIGGTVATLAVDAGYDVVIANSRKPDTLGGLVERLGQHARAATPAEAAAVADIIVVAIPLSAYQQVPAEHLAGKVVVDAINYLPDRDGHVAELDDDSTTSSQLLQAHLPGARVVKAFNAMFFGHLATLGRRHGAADRSAIPIAGDDQAAKTVVTAFLDAIGFDAFDIGPLSEGWRFQRGAIDYPYTADGSFEHPQPAGAARLTSVLGQAKRYRAA